MTDLLTLSTALALPDGAQLVSDHGAVALVIVRHDGPDTVTLSRVALGSPVSLLEAIQAAQARGVSLMTPTLTVLPNVAPVLVDDAAAATCPDCGKTFANAHGVATHQARKHRVPVPALPAPKAAPAPEAKPAATEVPTPYGEALPPDHSFRDELVAAIEDGAARW